MSEIWRRLDRFPLFEISNYGTLRKVSTKVVYNPYLSNRGYLTVTLYNSALKRSFTVGVHVLVAEAFHGPRPLGLKVNHKDTNKLNNREDNLKYITHQENIKHAVRAGIQMRPGKLTKEQVLDVRKTYNQYKGRARDAELFRLMAERLKVRPATIWEIVTRRSWKYC